MSNFTTRKQFLLPSLDLDVKEREKMDRFLKLLEKSNVESLFPNRRIDGSINGGRPPYNYHNLLAVVLYGFAFGSPTLRDIETSCKYDLRYIYELSGYGLDYKEKYRNLPYVGVVEFDD